MPPFALPDSRFSARFCLFGCFLIDSSLSMTSSTVFPWTRDMSWGQRSGWGRKVGSCYSTFTKQQIWSHRAHSLVSLCPLPNVTLHKCTFSFWAISFPWSWTTNTVLSMPASKTSQHQWQDANEDRFPLSPMSQSSGLKDQSKTVNPEPTAKYGQLSLASIWLGLRIKT